VRLQSRDREGAFARNEFSRNRVSTPESSLRPLWYDDPRRWETAFEPDMIATSSGHCTSELAFPESADFVSFKFVTQDSQSSW